MDQKGNSYVPIIAGELGGGFGKANVAALMCSTIGGSCHLRCLSSSPCGLLSSSSLDQLPYVVRALFQESKKWKLMGVLRPETRIHSVSLIFWTAIASFLLHSVCQCKLQSQSMFKRGELCLLVGMAASTLYSALLEMWGLKDKASEMAWILVWS